MSLRSHLQTQPHLYSVGIHTPNVHCTKLANERNICLIKEGGLLMEDG